MRGLKEREEGFKFQKRHPCGKSRRVERGGNGDIGGGDGRAWVWGKGGRFTSLPILKVNFFGEVKKNRRGESDESHVEAGGELE